MRGCLPVKRRRQPFRVPPETKDRGSQRNATRRFDPLNSLEREPRWAPQSPVGLRSQWPAQQSSLDLQPRARRFSPAGPGFEEEQLERGTATGSRTAKLPRILRMPPISDSMSRETPSAAENFNIFRLDTTRAHSAIHETPRKRPFGLANPALCAGGMLLSKVTVSRSSLSDSLVSSCLKGAKSADSVLIQRR
jgi:hypothetical protein